MIRLRLASKEDLIGILNQNISEYWKNTDNWSMMNQREKWEYGSWWADIDLLQWHFKILKMCKGGIIVAIEDDQIIGQLDFVQSYPANKSQPELRTHIIWMLVHPKFRRRGVASSLLDYLVELSSVPIWVEPEDMRSAELYSKYGYQVTNLSNWEHRGNIQVTSAVEINHSESSIAVLFSAVSSGWELIGNYYAPSFDYHQLENSDEVREYLWGETPSNLCKNYKFGQTEVIALLSQYPRIAVSPEWRSSELKLIFAILFSDIYSIGFETIFIQNYSDDKITEILGNLGCKNVIENDAVFQLNRS